MGFTAPQARKALRETVRRFQYTPFELSLTTSLFSISQGKSIERAIEWLFSHPDDDGSSSPSDAAPSSSSASKTPPGSSSLPAKYRLKAFISHKGPSVHSGHYVAHVWTGQADQNGGGKGAWVLFNDEKVVRADDGEQAADKLKELAYVYVFERV